MFQQVVMDPIRSRCTGFGLHDWPPQLSQSEGFIVDFSVIRGEVNFHHIFLLLYGLEFSTVMGRGGVICECRSMLVSNIFGVCDGSTILSIQILLGGADIFPRYFPHPIPYILYRNIGWQFWDIFCPWLTFLLVEETPRPGFASFVIPNVRNCELGWWMYADQEGRFKIVCPGKSVK